jgi:hypothetical protein
MEPAFVFLRLITRQNFQRFRNLFVALFGGERLAVVDVVEDKLFAAALQCRASRFYLRHKRFAVTNIAFFKGATQGADLAFRSTKSIEESLKFFGVGGCFHMIIVKQES